jgi:hypothetical protein
MAGACFSMASALAVGFTAVPAWGEGHPVQTAAATGSLPEPDLPHPDRPPKV